MLEELFGAAQAARPINASELIVNLKVLFMGSFLDKSSSGSGCAALGKNNVIRLGRSGKEVQYRIYSVVRACT